MTFHIGQKVVYVGIPASATSPHFDKYEIGDTVVKGKIYTVRWVGDQEFITASGKEYLPAIRLEEIKRRWGTKDPINIIEDCPFGASAFRPVEYKAMEVFRKIAADVTAGKKVKIDG